MYAKNFRHDFEIFLHAKKSFFITVSPEPEGSWFKDDHNSRCEALKTVLSDVQKEWGQSFDYLMLSESDSSRCFHKLWKSILLFEFLAYRSERHSFHFQFENNFCSCTIADTTCYIRFRRRKAFLFLVQVLQCPKKTIYLELLFFSNY